MERSAVEEQIRAILCNDFQVPQDRITMDATFRGDLRLDSLEIVDFIMLLQKDFGIKSPLETYRGIHTLAMLVDFVVAQKQAA